MASARVGERHGGVEAHAALGGAARDVVLHPEPGEDAEAAVVHLHGEVDDELALDLPKDQHERRGEIELPGRDVEMVLSDPQRCASLYRCRHRQQGISHAPAPWGFGAILDACGVVRWECCGTWPGGRDHGSPGDGAPWWECVNASHNAWRRVAMRRGHEGACACRATAAEWAALTPRGADAATLRRACCGRAAALTR